jgi:hypothetical protein
VTDLSVPEEDVVLVDVPDGFDPESVTVTDDGVNTSLDFGFGTIALDGITGGGTPFTSIDEINDGLGYDAVQLV